MESIQQVLNTFKNGGISFTYRTKFIVDYHDKSEIKNGSRFYHKKIKGLEVFYLQCSISNKQKEK